MKIVLAFDSYKNCLSSPEICRIIRSEIIRNAPDWQVVSMPLGDGGEGTAQAIVSASGGVMKELTVCGPLSKPVTAQYGILPDNSAVFEMASASGIELISADERNPMSATTYGTGELIRHIVTNEKCSRLTIGIGGSATVDGGIGMLQALGAEFFDENGRLLPAPASGYDIAEIRKISVDKVLPELAQCRIKIASDVTNPLCGSNGAAQVFAPQKGANAGMVERLENNLKNFGTLSVTSGIADNFNSPGDGAAGGLGFALRNYLHAESSSGAELVLDLLDFDNTISDAALVITGEGCSDRQTALGKLPAVVAEHARRKNVPVILLSGALGKGSEKLAPLFCAVLSLSSTPCSLEQAIDDCEKNLIRMSNAIVNILKLQREVK